MTFDIYKLDKLIEDDEEFEKAFTEYGDTLMDLFLEPPEAKNYMKTDPRMGFWAFSTISYGYQYIGVTIPQMRRSHVEEMLTELFPQKITLRHPDNADDCLPELIVFWKFLKREYQLPAANDILNYLESISPENFKESMNDPSNFGMAKSMFTSGLEAGFDMSKEEEAAAFMLQYNASLLSKQEQMETPPELTLIQGKRDKQKRKRKRKIAQATRKKNKKRK